MKMYPARLKGSCGIWDLSIYLPIVYIYIYRNKERFRDREIEMYVGIQMYKIM